MLLFLVSITFVLSDTSVPAYLFIVSQLTFKFVSWNVKQYWSPNIPLGHNKDKLMVGQPWCVVGWD